MPGPSRRALSCSNSAMGDGRYIVRSRFKVPRASPRVAFSPAAPATRLQPLRGRSSGCQVDLVRPVTATGLQEGPEEFVSSATIYRNPAGARAAVAHTPIARSSGLPPPRSPSTSRSQTDHGNGSGRTQAATGRCSSTLSPGVTATSTPRSSSSHESASFRRQACRAPCPAPTASYSLSARLKAIRRP